MPQEPAVLALLSTLQAIRRCFWLLKNASDALIADLGVTASQRAVLEHLATIGPATVPAIAQHKAVTRQAIQELMDSLLQKHWVTAAENPAHRRSSIYALSRSGRALFRTIQSREARILTRLARQFDARLLANAATQLALLQQALKDSAPPGDPHD
jgi:DNA-binding MarR family transcriptional regulator